MTATTATIRTLLASSNLAVEEALLRLLDRQTADEQTGRFTKHANGQGFTAFDAEFLTSLAEQVRENRWARAKGSRLSPKQLACARKKVMKYTGQLLEEAAAKTARKAASRCADCGARDELTGHQECQFPRNHA